MTASGELVRGWAAAAAVAGRSVASVRKLVSAERLAAGKDPAGSYVFRRADLEALLPTNRAACDAERKGGGQGAVLTGDEETANGTDVAPTGAASTDTAVSVASPGRAVSAPASVASPDTPGAASGGGTALSTAMAGRQVVARAPMTVAAEPGAGEIAAMVFADIAAGRTLCEIVVERHLAPEVVREAHQQWLALQEVDDASTPAAEARLVALEAALVELRAALEQQAGAAVAVEAALRAELAAVGGRLVAIERRPAGDRSAGMVARLGERLDAIERLVRTLPAAPLAIDRRCGCGGHLVVAAACSTCAAGTARAG